MATTNTPTSAPTSAPTSEENKVLDTCDQAFNEKGKETLSKLEQAGLKVQLLGVIQNGTIELDQASLEELAAKYPDINMMFVALNSPFDPAPCAI